MNGKHKIRCTNNCSLFKTKKLFSNNNVTRSVNLSKEMKAEYVKILGQEDYSQFYNPTKMAQSSFSSSIPFFIYKSPLHNFNDQIQDYAKTLK